MLSMQSHNQVLYHLTQFTSTFTPRSTPFALTINRQNGHKNQRTQILCNDSFLETLKNCKELFLDVNTKTFSLQRISTKDAWNVLRQLSKGGITKVPQKNNKWKVSYISGPTFEDNKRGFPNHLLSEPETISSINVYFRPNHGFCSHNNLFNLQKNQARFFKTDRGIRAEIEKNPTLRMRVQKWLGVNLDSGNKLESLSAANFISNPTSAEQSDTKLKKLLKDITVDEQERIKIAFAEGYLHGRELKPKGFMARLTRAASQIAFLTLLLGLGAVVLSAFKSLFGGGALGRLRLGSKVEVDAEEIHETFNDVKGVDEAKSELMDVVEFLKNPEKFSALGGKLPNGVLLVGPPGTGKTLLARAVAGEAGVPFFHAAGAEFDEILVGQGARRVRDLFKAAKERAPCVIFIDEIDSVGAKRTNSALHPYANQTINQLLSEMDGFHQNEGVIVLGATNRAQDLDKALLRPGRFDTEVVVNVPDLAGRKEIFDLYLSRVLTREVDSGLLAKATIGFTGADIENMVNQAALRAAIEGAKCVTMDHLERARDKVIMGPEGKKKIQDENDLRITAYHESGHALVAYYTKDATPLHKVTIIPRGRSLGHTSFVPHKEELHQTRAQMLASMDVGMGGRAAEELIFGNDKVTSGAANDFENATVIAESMVKKFGMSDKVGFRVHRESDQYFGSSNDYGPATTELIDNEIKRLLQESYERARMILKTHNKDLKNLAEALTKYETLDAEEVKAIMNGKKIRNEQQQQSSNLSQTVVDVPSNIM